MKPTSAALAHIACLALGSCQAGPSTDAPDSSRGTPARDGAEARDPKLELPGRTDAGGHVSEADHTGSARCTMAGSPCPSDHLPRVSSELGADGWRRLRALAEEGMVALVVSGERVEIVDGCRLPGRYHEAVAAADSPGRAWGANRLSFLPEEPSGCERATHVVASFAIRGEHDGEAIVLPLPCPSLGSGVPKGCIGAGLDDGAREAAARERWKRAHAATRDMKHEELAATLPGMLEAAALMPDAATYEALVQHLGFLTSERYGGCLWYADAVHSAELLAGTELGAEARPQLSHQIEEECEARPSLLTCFPQHFLPGYGGNCW